MKRLFKLGAPLLLASSLLFAMSEAKRDGVQMSIEKNGTTFSITEAQLAEVKDHIEKAALYCKEKGNAVCIEEFHQKKSQWVRGDIYIWVNDFKGVMTSHPKKQHLRGKNLFKYKDLAGNYLFQDFITLVKKHGSGWVDYVWAHPKTNKQTPKISYIKGIGDDQLIGAGVYYE